MMRQRQSLALTAAALVVAAALSLPSATTAHNGSATLALPMEGIVIDGDLSDWPAGMARHPILLPEYGETPGGELDFSASFRIGYGAGQRALYVAVEVSDQSVVIDESEARNWDTQDGCEIYIGSDHGADGDGVIQFVVFGSNPGSLEADGARATVAFEHLESGHVYEWRIDIDPADDDAIPLGPLTSVGIDIVVEDKDEDGSFSWMAWGRGGGKGGSAERLGDALLVKSKADVGTVSGMVTAEASGKPYAGLALEARGSGSAAGSARSGSDGRYQLMLLPGEYALHPTDGQGVRPFEVSGVMVKAGEDTPVDLAIQPPGRIAGTVTKSRDQPYANLVLDASRDGDSIARGRTDEDGHYQFNGLTPGEYSLRPGAGQGVTPFEIASLTVSAGRETTADFDVAPRPYQAVLRVQLPAGLSERDIRTVSGRVDSLIAALDLTVVADGSGSVSAAPTNAVNRRLELPSLDSLNETRGALHGDESWEGPLADTDWDLRLIGGPRGAGSSTSAGEGEGRPAGNGHRLGKTDLADVEVTDLLQTGDGQLWAATEGKGLLRSDGGQSSAFRTADGLVHDYTRALLQDRDGALWIGTDGAGLCRYDGDGFTTYTTADGLAHNVVTALAEDGEGNLWIGTEGGGLCRYDGRTFVAYGTGDGLPSNWIVSLLVTADGDLWVGTEDAGAVRIDGESFARIGTGDGLGHNWVGALLESRDGSVWLGTLGGVSRYADGRIQTMMTGDGLSHNWVSSLAEDADGRLWIGTEGGGVCRYDDGKIAVIAKATDASDPTVGALVVDADNALWIGSDKGLSRYSGE